MPLKRNFSDSNRAINYLNQQNQVQHGQKSKQVSGKSSDRDNLQSHNNLQMFSLSNIHKSKEYQKTFRRSTFKSGVSNQLFNKKNPFEDLKQSASIDTTYQAVFSPQSNKNGAILQESLQIESQQAQLGDQINNTQSKQPQSGSLTQKRKLKKVDLQKNPYSIRAPNIIDQSQTIVAETNFGAQGPVQNESVKVQSCKNADTTPFTFTDNNNSLGVQRQITEQSGQSNINFLEKESQKIQKMNKFLQTNDSQDNSQLKTKVKEQKSQVSVAHDQNKENLQNKQKDKVQIIDQQQVNSCKEKKSYIQIAEIAAKQQNLILNKKSSKSESIKKIQHHVNGNLKQGQTTATAISHISSDTRAFDTDSTSKELLNSAKKRRHLFSNVLKDSSTPSSINKNQEQHLNIHTPCFEESPTPQNLKAMNPTEIMNYRWFTKTVQKLNLVDKEEVINLKDSVCQSQVQRQFAPEFSQASYLYVLKEKEFAIVDYFYSSGKDSSLKVSPCARKTMVQLIEQIHGMKVYAEETFYLAVSIADRYLSHVARNGLPTPSLIELGVISILLAAKINEHELPSFYNMIKAINCQLGKKLVSFQRLVTLEEQILKALQFEMHTVTQLWFLERFLRLFNLDLKESPRIRKKAGQSQKIDNCPKTSLPAASSTQQPTQNKNDAQNQQLHHQRSKSLQSIKNNELIRNETNQSVQDKSSLVGKWQLSTANDKEAKINSQMVSNETPFAKAVNFAVKQISRLSVQENSFLNYRPSQMAAIILIISIKITGNRKLAKIFDFPFCESPRLTDLSLPLFGRGKQSMAPEQNLPKEFSLDLMSNLQSTPFKRPENNYLVKSQGQRIIKTSVKVVEERIEVQEQKRDNLGTSIKNPSQESNSKEHSLLNESSGEENKPKNDHILGNIWTEQVEEITQIYKQESLMGPYVHLVNILANYFDKKKDQLLVQNLLL